MDGATFFELPRSSTDYPNAAIDHNKAAITELCENSGLHYEYDESSYGKVRLYVNSRGEADTAAKLVSDIFSVQGGIHIKNENSSLCPNRPSVNVYFSGSELCLINFPYDGEQPPLRDVLAEQFLFYHASEIRRGYAICDLTEEELESIPAKYLYMTYNGIESNEFYFFYSTDDGKYYMEISDILPTDGIYMGLVQFNALCDAFGIEYEETSDRMIWYVGKDKFYAVLSEDNEHVTVLKNGTPCCRIELYYSSTRDNTYLCRVTPDELAIMLNAVYTSNNTLGRVVYSHNEP